MGLPARSFGAAHAGARLDEVLQLAEQDTLSHESAARVRQARIAAWPRSACSRCQMARAQTPAYVCAATIAMATTPRATKMSDEARASGWTGLSKKVGWKPNGLM